MLNSFTEMIFEAVATLCLKASLQARDAIKKACNGRWVLGCKLSASLGQTLNMHYHDEDISAQVKTRSARLLR